MLSFHRWLTTHPYAPPYQVALTTLERLKTDNVGTTKTTDDALLKRLIIAASTVFCADCRRTFIPYDATRSLTWQNATRLRLDEDLLSITSITDSTGALSGGQYTTYPRNVYPIAQIQTLAAREFTYSTNRENAISIVGTWGFHPDPAAMWVNETTLTAAIASSSTSTATVSSVAAIGTYDTLKIGSEYTRVESISGSTLTLKRGVNGSTATAHDNAATVYVYRVPDDIRHAVTLLAGYLYDVRDNYGSQYATTDGAVEVAKLAPEIIDATVMHYRAKR